MMEGQQMGVLGAEDGKGDGGRLGDKGLRWSEGGLSAREEMALPFLRVFFGALQRFKDTDGPSRAKSTCH